MRFLVDMNLAPAWVAFLDGHGWDAVHWSEVGDPRAPDKTILEWAAGRGCVLFTHDLDFSAILAGMGANKPSLIQVRTTDVLPDAIGSTVVNAIKTCTEARSPLGPS